MPIDNQLEETAPHAPQTTTARAADTAAEFEISDASAAESAAPRSITDADAPHTAAVADDLEYTLTVQQARSIFVEHQRKVPAERTLQIYCQEGTIAAKKIRTTYGSEWLINEASLFAYLNKQPVLTTSVQPQQTNAEAPHAPQTTTARAAEIEISDASAAESAAPRSMTDADATQPIGERRTLAHVLIENAKLLATIEGQDKVITAKNETITELKDDRSFLRDELADRRTLSRDIKQIASEMLGTVKMMALGRALPSGDKQPRQADQASDANELPN